MADAFQYDVFLSHSAKDKAVVRPLAERLRADGLKVWFDEWVLKAGDRMASSGCWGRHSGALTWGASPFCAYQSACDPTEVSTVRKGHQEPVYRISWRNGPGFSTRSGNEEPNPGGESLPARPRAAAVTVTVTVTSVLRLTRRTPLMLPIVT